MKNISVIEVTSGGKRYAGAIWPHQNSRVEARALLARLGSKVKRGFRVQTTEFEFLNQLHTSDGQPTQGPYVYPRKVKRYGFR